MNTTTAAVANRVKEALTAEGYTHKEVAHRLNISISQTSRLLSGKSALKFEHVSTLGRFLGINPRELLGITTTKNDNYLTITEAATTAHRHPDTLRKSITTGTLPSTQRVHGGRHLIRESDLNAWMAGAR